jgi:hypothetical protein
MSHRPLPRNDSDNEAQSPHLFLATRLFEEWLCDQWSRVEGERLDWVKFNQDQLRTDTYRGMQDALQQGNSAAEIGRQVILPSTFIGGPRHMQQLFQDATAVVAKHGKPDLFITMTCNPKWPEIQAELMNGQTANDRPDLLARVFKLKLQEMMDLLINKAVLGRVVAHMHTIEFQKRGLPHAHILLILAPEDKLHSADDYDRSVHCGIRCVPLIGLRVCCTHCPDCARFAVLFGLCLYLRCYVQGDHG